MEDIKFNNFFFYKNAHDLLVLDLHNGNEAIFKKDAYEYALNDKKEKDRFSCMKCREPLVFNNGLVKDKYFSHKPKNINTKKCELVAEKFDINTQKYISETIEHKILKSIFTIIKEKKFYFTLPVRIISLSNHNILNEADNVYNCKLIDNNISVELENLYEQKHIIINEKTINIKELHIEKLQSKNNKRIIPDIVIVDENEREYNIEFAVTHYVDEEKRNKIININKNCIEISIPNLYKEFPFNKKCSNKKEYLREWLKNHDNFTQKDINILSKAAEYIYTIECDEKLAYDKLKNDYIEKRNKLNDDIIFHNDKYNYALMNGSEDYLTCIYCGEKIIESGKYLRHENYNNYCLMKNRSRLKTLDKLHFNYNKKILYSNEFPLPIKKYKEYCFCFNIGEEDIILKEKEIDYFKLSKIDINNKIIYIEDYLCDKEKISNLITNQIKVNNLIKNIDKLSQQCLFCECEIGQSHLDDCIMYEMNNNYSLENYIYNKIESQNISLYHTEKDHISYCSVCCEHLNKENKHASLNDSINCFEIRNNDKTIDKNCFLDIIKNEGRIIFKNDYNYNIQTNSSSRIWLKNEYYDYTYCIDINNLNIPNFPLKILSLEKHLSSEEVLKINNFMRNSYFLHDKFSHRDYECEFCNQKYQHSDYCPIFYEEEKFIELINKKLRETLLLEIKTDLKSKNYKCSLNVNNYYIDFHEDFLSIKNNDLEFYYSIYFKNLNINKKNFDQYKKHNNDLVFLILPSDLTSINNFLNNSLLLKNNYSEFNTEICQFCKSFRSTHNNDCIILNDVNIFKNEMERKNTHKKLTKTSEDFIKTVFFKNIITLFDRYKFHIDDNTLYLTFYNNYNNETLSFLFKEEKFFSEHIVCFKDHNYNYISVKQDEKAIFNYIYLEEKTKLQLIGKYDFIKTIIFFMTHVYKINSDFKYENNTIIFNNFSFYFNIFKVSYNNSSYFLNSFNEFNKNINFSEIKKIMGYSPKINFNTVLKCFLNKKNIKLTEDNLVDLIENLKKNNLTKIFKYDLELKNNNIEINVEPFINFQSKKDCLLFLNIFLHINNKIKIINDYYFIEKINNDILEVKYNNEIKILKIYFEDYNRYNYAFEDFKARLDFKHFDILELQFSKSKKPDYLISIETYIKKQILHHDVINNDIKYNIISESFSSEKKVEMRKFISTIIKLKGFLIIENKTYTYVNQKHYFNYSVITLIKENQHFSFNLIDEENNTNKIDFYLNVKNNLCLNTIEKNIKLN